MVTRVVVAVTSVVVLCLVGCTPTATQTAPPTPPVTTPAVTPTPTVAPVETAPTWSAEQQAAIDAVEKWYPIYNEVLRGERNPNDLATVARGELLADTQRTYNDFGLAKLTVEGDVTVSDLMPSELTENDRPTIAVDLCEDSTKWSVLDSDGNDVLKLGDKIVRPLVMTVEQWPKDGWFVTASKKGSRSC